MICKILFPRKGKLYSDICPPNKKPPVWVVLNIWCEQRGTHLTIFSQFFNPFDRFLPAFLSVCLTFCLALFENNEFFAKCKRFCVIFYSSTAGTSPKSMYNVVGSSGISRLSRSRCPLTVSV